MKPSMAARYCMWTPLVGKEHYEIRRRLLCMLDLPRHEHEQGQDEGCDACDCEASGAQCTTDGSLNAGGSPAARHLTGGWRACSSILTMEFFYGVAFYGVMDNLVTYLTTAMRESNAAAARGVSTWQATCFLTPLAGALLADSCWGAHRTMLAACSVAVAGLLMVFLSALVPLLDKSSEAAAAHMGASRPEIVLFIGLYMAAIGLGGLPPCIMSFGADQFDDGDPSERAAKASFINWYVFIMSCSSLAASTAVVWVRDHHGWALGLSIPAVVLAAGLPCLIAGARSYKFQRPRGSPLTGICQVVVAAVRKFHVAPPADSSLLYNLLEDDDCAIKGVQRIEHTTGLRSFDKAAVVAASDTEAAAVEPGRRNPWRLCPVTQVEEVKILARMLPVWVTILFFYTASAQASSTFVEQGIAMDVSVGSVRVPPATMITFFELSIIVLIPLYDRALVPAARRLTGREEGIPALLRIGVGLGLGLSVLAMAAAALVEAARQGTPTSILWQVLQYAGVGAGEVFTTVGQFEFFYGQAPAAMRTVCAALGMLDMAAGDYLSSLVLAAVQWATSAGGRPGWIPDDVDQGHLDRFFWMMAGLGCVNLVALAGCALRYNSSRPA